MIQMNSYIVQASALNLRGSAHLESHFLYATPSDKRRLRSRMRYFRSV